MMRQRTLGIADSVRHENNFNLIRLVAAISVLFGHAYPIMGATADPTRIFFGAADHYIGDVAVDVFFITSGFLLAMSAAKGTSIWQFVINRILRIYPALIICNLIVVAACWGLFNDFRLSFLLEPQTHQYLIRNSLMLYNAADSFAANNWLPNSFGNVRIGLANGSLWTLVAEIKAYFYMVIAMVVASLAFGDSWKKLQPAIWTALLVLSLFVFEYLPFVGGEPRFERLFVFFFAGAALYSYRCYIALDWRIAVIAVLFLWVLKADAPHWFSIGSYLAYPYLVMFAAYGLPHARPPNSIGDFSYGVYIYGWFSQTLVASLSGMTVSPIANFLLGVIVSLVFAVPSWFLVEKPILGLKRTKVAKAPQTEPLVIGAS
jgi:peptidoglycan/LPS O-acetylase OafA/YrhL